MPNVRVHKPNGMLFFDFRWNGRRFREYTALPDSAENRKKLEAVLNKIEAAIGNGSFDYAAYFPNSKAAAKLSDGDWDQPGMAELVLLEGVLLTGSGAKEPFTAKIGSFPTKGLRSGACAPFMDDLDHLMGRVESARAKRLA